MLKRKRRHKLGTSNTDPARFNKSQIKIYGYLIPISIVMLLPIIYIVVSAFKPMDELFAYPPRFYVKILHLIISGGCLRCLQILQFRQEDIYSTLS